MQVSGGLGPVPAAGEQLLGLCCWQGWEPGRVGSQAGKGRAALLQCSNTRPVLLAVGLLTSASWAELFLRSFQVRRAAWRREHTLPFSVALNSLCASCRSYRWHLRNQLVFLMPGPAGKWAMISSVAKLSCSQRQRQATHCYPRRAAFP